MFFYLTISGTQLADDEIFEAFILGEVSSMLDASSDRLFSFLDGLEGCDYNSFAVNNLLENAYNTMTFTEKAEFVDDLDGMTFYGTGLQLSVDDLSAYIEENGTETIYFSSGTKGYYDNEDHQRSSHRDYGDYGTYKDYSYSYYGDFMREYYSGYRTESITNISAVPVSGTNILFRGMKLEDISAVPRPDECLLSGSCLLISNSNDIWVYNIDSYGYFVMNNAADTIFEEYSSLASGTGDLEPMDIDLYLSLSDRFLVHANDIMLFGNDLIEALADVSSLDSDAQYSAYTEAEQQVVYINDCLDELIDELSAVPNFSGILYQAELLRNITPEPVENTKDSLDAAAVNYSLYLQQLSSTFNFFSTYQNIIEQGGYPIADTTYFEETPWLPTPDSIISGVELIEDYSKYENEISYSYSFGADAVDADLNLELYINALFQMGADAYFDDWHYDPKFDDFFAFCESFLISIEFDENIGTFIFF